MNEIIKEKGLNKDKVLIMAQDEGRFERINIPRASWAPKGIRPLAPRRIVREAFYAYCAVCPSLGEMCSLLLPYANTDMMYLFLDHVSEEFKLNEIIMQVDGAGWHKSKDLKIPKNIHFIIQPPYSPEVNLVEHIWDEIREKKLHNQAFKTIHKTMNKVSEGINELSNNNEY